MPLRGRSATKGFLFLVADYAHSPLEDDVMLSALRKWLGGVQFVGKSTSISQSGLYAHLQDLEDEEIPRYPPFAKGLPATPVDKLMATQRQLIAKIHQSLGFSQEDSQQLLYPVIRNYAAFVHLLPASEGHHHRGAGGLFRHGLEVAFWATQASEGTIFEPEGSPEEKLEKEPRWRFGVFLGALMHDLGKPLSDVVVTDKPGALEWNPYAESLEEWLNETGVTHYFLRWNKGRHQRHERLATLALNMVMTAEVKRYLRPPGPELMKTLIEAISGTSAQHAMAKLIMLADAESVKRDLKESRLNIDGNSLGVSIEPYIIDAIRSLVQSGRWKTNRMDAQVWHLSQGTFIAWRQAVPSLVQKLKENSVPAVPHDADTLADYLIERGFALPRPIPGREAESDSNYYRYWEVTVSVEAEEGLVVEPKILMLRMEDSFLVFGNATNPPETLPARIPGLDGDGQLIVQEASDPTQNESAEPTEEGQESGHDQGDQPPESVRERLQKFKPVGKGEEGAFDALSNLLGGTPSPVHDAAAVNSIDSSNIDNTAITVNADSESVAHVSPSFQADSASSINGSGTADWLAPPNLKTPRPSAPSVSEKPTKSPKAEPTEDLSALFAPPQPKGKVTGREKAAPKAADDFGDLLSLSGAAGTVSAAPLSDGVEEPIAKPSEKLHQEVAHAKQRHKDQAETSSFQASDDVESDHGEGGDVLDALTEFASAMGADLGMDLPFELEEASHTSQDDLSEDDIQYESVDPDESEVTLKEGNQDGSAPPSDVQPVVEQPNVSPSPGQEKPCLLDPELAPLTLTSVISDSGHSVSESNPKKPRKRRKSQREVSDKPGAPTSEANGQSGDLCQAALQPPEPLPSPRLSDGNSANTAKDKDSDGEASAAWIDQLIGAEKREPETTKAEPTPLPVTDFSFLLGTGASKKKGDQAAKKKATPCTIAHKTAPVESITVSAANTHTLEVKARETAQEIALPESLLHADSDLPDSFPEGTRYKEESHHVNLPFDGPEVPPIESYNDLPEAFEYEADDSLYPDAPADQSACAEQGSLPDSSKASEYEAPNPLCASGNAADEHAANQYLTDLLAPILNGSGLLGQVILRQPAGHLEVLVTPASQLLEVDQEQLITALVKGGAVMTTPDPLAEKCLTLTQNTERWVNKLLRDREQERLRMLEEQDNTPLEKPTTSLTRRKTRTPPIAVEEVSASEAKPDVPAAITVHEPRVVSTAQDYLDVDHEDVDDHDDADVVPSPKSSMTSVEALTRLREMIIDGEGAWLVGSVTKEPDGYSVSDLCLEKVVSDNPQLTRRLLRTALSVSPALKMSVVAQHKRLYVKE